MISKRGDAPYRSGRSKDWLKIKCGKRAEFVIGGYSRSTAKDRAFSSLLLGTFNDGELVFAGKVGTGFSSGDSTVLAKRFKPLERSKSPLSRCRRSSGVTRCGLTQARLRGGIHRVDAGRPLAPSEFSGLARGQTRG